MRNLILCLALIGCTTNPAALNTNGTAATASEQAAAVAYETYLTADAAYIAYLTASPSATVVAAVELKRLAARAALDAFANAVKGGAAVSTPQALTDALVAFTAVLAANNIKVGA